MKRDFLTEDEHKQLVEVGNYFWSEFSKLCNDCLKKMPAELEDLTEAYLQDKCSIYGRAINI